MTLYAVVNNKTRQLGAHRASCPEDAIAFVARRHRWRVQDCAAYDTTTEEFQAALEKVRLDK